MMPFKIDATVKDHVEIWPLYSFFVFLLGYIGFYTYSSISGVVFEEPDLSLVIGIGFFNLLVVLLLSERGKNRSMLLNSFFKLNVISLLAGEPVVVGLLIAINAMIFYSFSLFKIQTKTKTSISYAERRIRANNLSLRFLYIDGLILLIITLIWLFIDVNVFVVFFSIHALSMVFRKLNINKQKYIAQYIIVACFVPVLTSLYFLQDIRFSFFGLSRQSVVITTKEKNEYEGILIYKAENYVYLKTDSIRLIIPQDDVRTIRNKVSASVRANNGLSFLRDQYSTLMRGDQQSLIKSSH